MRYFQNPRSGWKHKAWGEAKLNPRGDEGKTTERAKRATVQNLESLTMHSCRHRGLIFCGPMGPGVSLRSTTGFMLAPPFTGSIQILQQLLNAYLGLSQRKNRLAFSRQHFARSISLARIVDRARELLPSSQIAHECAAPLRLPTQLLHGSRKRDVAALVTPVANESLPATPHARRSPQFTRCCSAPESNAQAPSLLFHRPPRDVQAFPLPGSRQKQSWHSHQARLVTRDAARGRQSSFRKH
jgi:hypothetical protein